MPRSIYELFNDVTRQDPTAVAHRFKKDGQWVDRTWRDFRDDVTRVAKGLDALGVGTGDRVAIVSQTRYEWVLCDFATVTIGAVTVGIYHSNLAPDCAYIVRHSDSMVAFAENDSQVAKLLEERDSLPDLRSIVVFEGAGDEANGVMSWDRFLALGADVPDERIVERGEKIGPDDLASLVYTSGTTGQPKGAMITHDNLLFASGSVDGALNVQPAMVTLLFLPLAHVFARLIVYLSFRARVVLGFAETMLTTVEDMGDVRPHFIASVPRLYEKIQERVMTRVEEGSGLKRKLFHWAVGVGRRVSRLRQAGRPVPAGLALQHRLADRLALHKVRNLFGNRITWTISGAAPLNPEIAEFFDACGVTILEGIGMTENTSFSNVNRPELNKFGTVGPPGPGVEVRVASDGEVQIRGRNVMKGYFKDPESSRDTIDAEGWLQTGDIGEIDEDGYLRITDRKKDLIVTAGGKNVAPQKIERILRTSRYIGQVVAYGDRKKYITALVTLEPENIKEWAAAKGMNASSAEELADHPEVRKLIESEVQRLNGQLGSFESVKKISIVGRDFTIDSGELTPTLKVKRKVVLERYGDRLEALYAT